MEKKSNVYFHLEAALRELQWANTALITTPKFVQEKHGELEKKIAKTKQLIRSYILNT